MRRSGLLAIALVWVFFLIAQLPAQVLVPLLPPSLQLGGISGSVWNGRAARVDLEWQSKVLRVGQVQWRLKPWSLLLLAPELDIRTQWGAQTLAATAALSVTGDVSVSNLSARVDTAWLRQWIPLYIGGWLELEAEQLRFHQQALVAAEGRLLWRDGVWAANAGDVALGSFVLDLHSNDGGIVGEVITVSGALQAEGSVALSPDTYQVALTLTGPALAQSGLREALQVFATPSAEGFDIVLSGSL